MPDARILVAEDERIVAMDIRSQLTGLGYKVTATAASGEDALVATASQRPDLVLMDIRLDGDMDGIEAAEAIRARLDIPVVFLTAYSDQETLDRAKRSAPFGYILKPFEERELHVAIECALCRHELEQETAAKKSRFEEQLRQSQKMEAVGQLISGVAHNFNNALAVVLGNIDLLLMDDPESPNLKDAEAAAARAADMVKQLMLFSERARYEHQSVEFSNLLEGIVEMCRNTFDRKIEIVLAAAAPGLRVRGDAGQLRQAFLNLLINARDALTNGAGGKDQQPRISTAVSTLRFQSPDEIRHLQARLGHYIRVEVRDNGAGMSAAVKDRIFEPFFTTKEVGQGTGLGLAAVYAIIREHGGWIECASTPGQGTSFSVYLPSLEVDEGVPDWPFAGVAEASAGQYPSGAGETVLLIEDEKLVQNTLAQILREYGYEVIVRGDGESGLEAYRRQRHEIDLVLLDLSLPRMSGREVLKNLLELDPNVKVLIATGYPSELARIEGAAVVLRKPFQMGELVRTVRGLLDRP